MLLGESGGLPHTLELEATAGKFIANSSIFLQIPLHRLTMYSKTKENFGKSAYLFYKL